MGGFGTEPNPNGEMQQAAHMRGLRANIRGAAVLKTWEEIRPLRFLGNCGAG